MSMFVRSGGMTISNGMVISGSGSSIISGNGNIFRSTGSNPSTMTINGVTYTGKCISSVNGKVTVDGVEVKSEENKSFNITVTITANVDGNIEVSAGTVTVNGNVGGSVKTASGNVEVTGEVKANVSTQSGDVTVTRGIGGNVNTMSGDVKADSITGECQSMSGDIVGARRS